MGGVFITGAQSGTGYGIAEHFAKQGWDVFITSRRGAEAKEAAKKLTADYGVFAKGYECNIRNEQQVIDIFNDIFDLCGYPFLFIWMTDYEQDTVECSLLTTRVMQ